jgi:acyl-CoA thioesterase
VQAPDQRPEARPEPTAAPDDPEAVAAAVGRFMAARDEFSRALGIELLELRPGYCRAGLTLAGYMVNGLGLTHGAAIFALADTAFAAACNSDGRASVALSMDIHFVRSPEPGARLLAEAEELRRGERTALCRMRVTDASGRLIAELHGMAFRKGEAFL